MAKLSFLKKADVAFFEGLPNLRGKVNRYKGKTKSKYFLLKDRFQAQARAQAQTPAQAQASQPVSKPLPPGKL